MINFTTKIIRTLPSADEFTKQINFGTALGLTNTAKHAQKAVMHALGDTFTLRGQWFNESMKYGIKVKMARPNDLQAQVFTQAHWLKIHEEGGTKTGSGNDLGIPVTRTGPNGEAPGLRRGRDKTAKIPLSQFPRAIRDLPRSFILNTKNGRVLFQRKGKGKRSKIVALYNLEPKAKIKKQSTFYDPIKDVVLKHRAKYIEEGIAKAFATGGLMRGRKGEYGPRFSKIKV
jgi:hypothetical protein